MPYRRFTVPFTDRQMTWLRLESKRTGRSISAIVREAVDFDLHRRSADSGAEVADPSR